MAASREFHVYGLTRPRLGGDPQNRKLALPKTELLEMVNRLDGISEADAAQEQPEEQESSAKPTRLIDIQDRAILLVGFQSAMRRSELAATEFDDLAWHEEGVLMNLRRSKTDPTGQGRLVPFHKAQNIDYCPVDALRIWIHCSEVTVGRLFQSITKGGSVGRTLSDHSIASILKKRAAASGLDPKDIGVHSFRRGFAIEAAKQGADSTALRNIGGWKNDATVDGYIHKANLFELTEKGRVL